MSSDNGLNIVDYLGLLFPLASRERLSVFVDSYCKQEVLNKKTLLFASGDANTRHYFVEKGLLRLYILDKSGREFNLLFAKEGQVLGDLASPKPTMYYLETVEDSIVYSVSDKQFLTYGKQILGLNEGGDSNLFRRSYVFLQKRFVDILSKTAEENFIAFREEHPELLQRLPQYHIASYLGVSAEFLSKIIARTSR